MEKNKNHEDSFPPAWGLIAVLAAIAFCIMVTCSGCSVCADCQCRTYTTQPGVDPLETESEVCGRDDIKETRGVHSQKVTVGNKTYTVTTDCTCRYQ